jgi:hypothetical protein
MSSAIADDSGVSYELKGTTETAIAASGGLVIEFCSDSPLIGLSCAHPSGLTVAGVNTTGSATAGTASDIDSTDHAIIKFVSTSAISQGATFDITLGGIHNPTAIGSFYARVVTYANSTDLGTYSNATTLGTTADEGSVALSTISAIGVTAYVRETMTFCVANTAPTAGCTGITYPTNAPNLTLGTGTPAALDPSRVDSGNVYTQISTNAASGAVVRMTDNNSCGGLMRAGASGCDIAPQTTDSSGAGTITAGNALFGVQLGTLAGATGGSTPTGTVQAATGSKYSATRYFMNYVAGGASGVTSTYGDPLLDTNSAPVSNQNMPLAFGASISNTTPAGIYKATIDLIATGTF